MKTNLDWPKQVETWLGEGRRPRVVRFVIIKISDGEKHLVALRELSGDLRHKELVAMFCRENGFVLNREEVARLGFSRRGRRGELEMRVVGGGSLVLDNRTVVAFLASGDFGRPSEEDTKEALEFITSGLEGIDFSDQIRP